MSCNNCIQINPLPRCIDQTDALIENIIFTDNINSSVNMFLKNVATGKNTFFILTTNGSGEVITTDAVASSGIDLTKAYDLMDHPYKLEFTDPLTSKPITAYVGTDSGCCIEFATTQTDFTTPIEASTDGCDVV